MAASAQDLLDAVNDELLKRLQSGTREFWVGGTDRWAGYTVKELQELRKSLMDEVAAADGGGASFQRVEVIE